MPEVRFYHLTATTAQQALPKLLEKTLERDKRAVVKLPDEDSVTQWNEYLWSHDPGSFLPHGSIKDPDPDTQPIFLTHVDENPGRAEYLFLAEGAKREDLSLFDMCAILFNGNDEEAVAEARRTWKALREQAYELTYWQQDENGKWGKNA